MSLIPDRIEFAKSVDVRKCPDVQAFIQAKENQEAYLLWARKEEPAKLVGEMRVSEPDAFSLRRFVRSFLP